LISDEMITYSYILKVANYEAIRVPDFDERVLHYFDRKIRLMERMLRIRPDIFRKQKRLLNKAYLIAFELLSSPQARAELYWMREYAEF